uniref:TNFR-Cys domain-containing protein n=1 Tax=Seriola lalandi dorsalis TaxID=1841481 RepID=A0A3B4YX93_SERLL
ILNTFPSTDYFKCVFPQLQCVQVQSEQTCDPTEFLLPNSTCVACPVCGPGEQLSQDCGFGDGGEGVCILCEEGKFSSNTGVDPCRRCTQCNLLNRLEKTACSLTNDALCGQSLTPITYESLLSNVWHVFTTFRQMWKITKYLYSGSVYQYNFEVLVLNLSIYILCYFLLQLHYISDGNIVLSTPLHLFDSFSY